jgi:hypothetical protein
LLPTDSVRASDLAVRCKFNLSYFDGAQLPASEFSSLDADFLAELLGKLKNFSKEKLPFWLHQRVGGGGLKVLALYDSFPVASDFVRPKSVPHDVRWGRFRLDNMTRLVGFVVPAEYSNQLSSDAGFVYDCNTFYIVFIDKDHRFYKTEDK